MKKYIYIFFILSVGLSMNSCRTGHIVTPLKYSMPKDENLNLNDINTCLEMALQKSRWAINSKTQKDFVVTDTWKRHSITVQIIYDKKDFKIEYKRSKNLSYRKSFWSNCYSIHKSANAKIKKLFNELIQKIKNYPEIKRELAALNSWIWAPFTQLTGQWGPPKKVFNNGIKGRIATYIYNTDHLPGYTYGYIGNGSISTTNHASLKKIWYIDFYINKGNLIYKWKIRIEYI